MSERLSGASTTFEAIVQEIAANNENWMSTIGRNAILSTPNNNAIDIRTEIAFTNMSQMFDTDKYSGKLALCLNLADIISEQVIRTQTCILGMQRPKKTGILSARVYEL